MSVIRKPILLALIALAGAPAFAADPPTPKTNPYLQDAMQLGVPFVPFGMPMPKGEKGKVFAPYEFGRIIPKEEKQKLMKAMLPMLANGLSMDMRDVMNYMTVKYKAKPGLSFDDVAESMRLRANQLNFKLVGHSPLWRDFMAVLGDQNPPRIEVFHYCDIATGRELLKAAPESLVYLPCRIGIMEDKDKTIWVTTLDWDFAWLESINGNLGVKPELAKAAIDIRGKIDNIMQAAANGEL